MKCLECKWREVIESGYNGHLGETIIWCFLCNKITGTMDKCKDFKEEK